MTPDEPKTALKAFLDELGEIVQVRRYTGAGPTRTRVDTPALARVKGYEASQLVGAIVQGDSRAILYVDDALAAILPLTTSDKLIVRGAEKAIKSVDANTRSWAGVPFGLDLQIGG